MHLFSKASFPLMIFSLLLGMLVSCDNQAKPPSKALLGVSAQSELWWISLTREPDTKIGPIKDSSGRGVSGVYDLAWNSAMSFAWAVGDHGYTLYRVEVSTGVATRVGALGTFVNGLTLGPTGVLIGAGYGRLYDIDATTGVATPISDLTLPCDSSGDLAYLNGYLYATTKCWGASSDSLIEVDLSAKTVRTVGNIGFSDVYGLSTLEGGLYGTTRYGELIRIDPSSGRAILLRTLSFGVYGTQSLP